MQKDSHTGGDRREPLRKAKTNRRSFRLGPGGYQAPTGKRTVELKPARGEGPTFNIAAGSNFASSVRVAQELFFAAAAALDVAAAAALGVAPVFLEELNGAPRAALEALKPSLIRSLQYSDSPWAQVRAFVEYRPLRKALKAWASRFKLYSDWIFDLAIAKLCPPDWDPALISTNLYDAPDLRLVGWDKLRESKVQAKARLIATIENHLAAVAEHATAQGFEPVPERREPMHFYWLAGYQIYGWPQSRVAEAVGIDRAAVVRAIDGLAMEMGLSPRRNDEYNADWTPKRIQTVLRSIEKNHNFPAPCDLGREALSHITQISTARYLLRPGGAER